MHTSILFLTEHCKFSCGVAALGITVTMVTALQTTLPTGKTKGRRFPAPIF